MSQKKYWKSFDELENTPAYQQHTQDEFLESLPFEESGSLMDAPTPRRDFLKYLGFSTAAVTLAASCEMPVRKIIPYAIKPDNITPGVAKYYASTFTDGAESYPIVVKTRDGRPIKIEGNSLSKITEGGANAKMQASILNLYDTNRLRFPTVAGKEVTWTNLDTNVQQSLAAGSALLFIPSVNGETNKQILQSFVSKNSNVTVVELDNISYSGILDAHQQTSGKRIVPNYRFDKAQTIVSIGADFLGTWVAPVVFAKQYSKGRKISAANPTMNKHIQFEGMLSLAGANADERYACRASEYGKVALALLGAINGTNPTFADQKLNKGIASAANELKKGNGLVVCGSNDVSVQIVINAINAAIGANGNTIDFSKGYNFNSSDSNVVAAIDKMKSGAINTVIIADSNPSYFLGAHFDNALKM